MFTGIIESIGIVKEVISSGSNKSFVVESSISQDLKIDQSLSHNGVCLTVEKADNNTHFVTAIDETLQKTNLSFLKENDIVNLERCLVMNGRLDGHIVQGHVDATATCLQTISKNGSWEFQFQFDEKFAPLVIEKGSICLNGISLTIFNVGVNTFTVAIIPYTYNHTNIHRLQPGSTVNIEFDMVGKYINRMQQLRQL